LQIKWRTVEHPRETKKNFERDDDEQRERERTQRETKKKRKERRLVFFLSSSYLWYLFSRIRAMIESNRGRFMYLFFCFGAVVLVVVVVVVFHVAREKKVMTKKLYLFWFEFQFFSTLIYNRHFNARYCCVNTE